MSRRVTITLDIDLAKYSKEAHMVTVQKIADALGAHAVSLFEDTGYKVHSASASTMMHYVRHTSRTMLRRAKKLRVVS
jgi:hypothetical protein